MTYFDITVKLVKLSKAFPSKRFNYRSLQRLLKLLLKAVVFTSPRIQRAYSLVGVFPGSVRSQLR